MQCGGSCVLEWEYENAKTAVSAFRPKDSERRSVTAKPYNEFIRFQYPRWYAPRIPGMFDPIFTTEPKAKKTHDSRGVCAYWNQVQGWRYAAHWVAWCHG